MSIKYGSLNVDERYSGILEPNLYYNPVLVPGVTCTDKYQIGPAGQIYVHKLTTSAVESGTPGRDFSDTAVSDTLIPIQLNNNFQRSYKTVSYTHLDVYKRQVLLYRDYRAIHIL